MLLGSLQGVLAGEEEVLVAGVGDADLAAACGQLEAVELPLPITEPVMLPFCTLALQTLAEMFSSLRVPLFWMVAATFWEVTPLMVILPLRVVPLRVEPLKFVPRCGHCQW